MLSLGTGCPHFAQIWPSSTVRFAESSLSIPNNFPKNPITRPLLFVLEASYR